MIHSPTYDLLDKLRADFDLKNDTALATFLSTQKSQISRIRHGKIGISAAMREAIHEKTGWPIKRIKELAAA